MRPSAALTLAAVLTAPALSAETPQSNAPCSDPRS